MRKALGIALLACTATACNVLLGNDPWTLASGGRDGAAADGGGDDGTTAVEAGDETNAPETSTGGDATAEAAVPEASPDTGVDSGLSPLLTLPAPGPTCDPAEGDTGCPSGTSCRIATTTTGRCDGTTPGHEGTWPCSQDSDCDDGLQCYNGDCHVLCPLGQTCAGGCECYDVGNVDVGICCPGA